jgi:hypothetical protein
MLAAGPVAGMVDVAWRFGTYLHARTLDDGGSWAVHPVPLPGTGSYASIAIAADGSVALSSDDQVVVSGDGGMTFGAPVDLDLDVRALVWSGAAELLACGTPVGDTAAWSCRLSPDRGQTFAAPVGIVASGFRNAAVVRRGPLDVVNAYVTHSGAPAYRTDLQSVRSLDGSATWSAPVAIAVLGNSALFPTAIAAADPAGVVWLAARELLFRSPAGQNWTEVTPCDPFYPARHLASTGPDELAILGSQQGPATSLYPTLLTALTTSVDGGQTNLLRRLHAQVAGSLDLVRLPGGRLAASWVENPAADMAARASYSDDGGATWSPAVTMNDLPLALDSQLDLAATAAGYLVAGWSGRDGDGCAAEVRVARSLDGDVFEPSMLVAQGNSIRGVRVEEDNAGSLVVLWREGTELWSATSGDSGASFTAPARVGGSLETGVDPSPLRAAGSALVLVVVTGDAACAACDTTVLRSEDGGASWQSLVIDPGVERPRGLDLVANGDILVGAHRPDLCDFVGCPAGTAVFRSLDAGLSWNWMWGVVSGGGTWGSLVAVDPDGTPFFYSLSAALNAVTIGSAGPGTYERSFIGSIPGSYSATGLVPAVGDLELLHDSLPGPDIVFRHATTRLLRDTTIRFLTPRADLAALFPLPPYVGVSPFGPIVDPDPTLIGDATRPLVFYGVDTDHKIHLVKDPAGLVQIERR